MNTGFSQHDRVADSLSRREYYRCPRSLNAIAIGTLLFTAISFDLFTVAAGVQSFNELQPFKQALSTNSAVSPEVGRTVLGLKAYESQITGVLDPESMTGSFYWTYVVENSTGEEQEARIQIALPSGSAITRATLWVNGVPQEAAFDSTVKVEQAYRWITQMHRDPLLVKQISPGHILIKAAPVLPGQRMQFRLGMTTIAKPGAKSATFGLPYIEAANLALACPQNVHIESTTPVKSNDSLMVSAQSAETFTCRGTIDERKLSTLKLSAKRPNRNNQFACRSTHSYPEAYIVARLESTPSGGSRFSLIKSVSAQNSVILKDQAAAHRLSTLWAYSEIERLNARNQETTAVELANVYRVVSSVSGATVLEQQSDYEHESLNRDIYKTISYLPSMSVDPETDYGLLSREPAPVADPFASYAGQGNTLDSRRPTLFGGVLSYGRGALQQTLSSSFSTVVSQLNCLNAYSASGTYTTSVPGFSTWSSSGSQLDPATTYFTVANGSPLAMNVQTAERIRGLARNLSIVGCLGGVLGVKCADNLIGPTIDFDYLSGIGEPPVGMLKSFSSPYYIVGSYLTIALMMFLFAFNFAGPLLMFYSWQSREDRSEHERSADFGTGLIWLISAIVFPELSQLGLILALVSAAKGKPYGNSVAQSNQR